MKPCNVRSAQSSLYKMFKKHPSYDEQNNESHGNWVYDLPQFAVPLNTVPCNMMHATSCKGWGEGGLFQ